MNNSTKFYIFYLKIIFNKSSKCESSAAHVSAVLSMTAAGNIDASNAQANL